MKQLALILSSVCFALTALVFQSKVMGQSCDSSQWFGGPVGGSSDVLFCGIQPTDIYGYGPNGLVITCKGCVQGGSTPVPHSSGFEHGGTASCTAFSKDMVIQFSQPVADVMLDVWAARTVRDNLGREFHKEPTLNPNGSPTGDLSFFLPGPGITQITITDPVEWNGGHWNISLPNATYMPESNYQQCHCSAATIPVPTPETLSSNVQSPWSMNVEVSADDGLVIRDVTLNGRYMAERLSSPYFTLDTTSIPPSNNVPITGKLMPNGTWGYLRSRLVDYRVDTTNMVRVIEARYVIDQIPGAPQDCLLISQRYEFYAPVEGDHCEPNAQLPCARWKPIVTYNFRSTSGNQLRSFQVAQRFHFMVDTFARNSVGIFRDCNYLVFPCVLSGGIVFTDKQNPVAYETYSRIIENGTDFGTWDNLHQTFLPSIDEPFWNAGCSECVHFHWRWAGHLPDESFGKGRPLIPASSNQDVDMAIVLSHPFAGNSDEEAAELHSETLPIREFAYVDGYRYDIRPKEVSFWYWSTGHQSSDSFSPTQGGFFNPADQTVHAYITQGSMPNPAGPSAHAKSKTSSHLRLKRTKPSLSITSTSQDWPESVTFGNRYADGSTTYNVIDPSSLGSLPPGYVTLDDDAFDIGTQATVSGPHVVTFNVSSVNNQTTFNGIRILHAEPDSFDPSRIRLIDRTILSPEAPLPDYDNRKISAKVNALGTFLIATFTPPSNTDVADLSVGMTRSPSTPTVGNNVTYTVTVTNNGPQIANDVMLKDVLAPEINFVSAVPSAGTCQLLEEGSVLCSLDSLQSSQSATITIIGTAVDGNSDFPTGGKILSNVAVVKANEGDANLENNSVISSATVLPDPNPGPTISITSPVSGSSYVGPVVVTVNATATDSNGNVDHVDFYADGNLLGVGSSGGSNQYSINWANPDYGNHLLTAVATDNSGKVRASTPVSVSINGTAAVSIVSPANWTNFNTPASIIITANASIGGGTVSQVDFFSDGSLLGTGTLTGTNHYGVTWTTPRSGSHSLTAVVTDSTGIKTISSPINITVNDPPAVRLLSPAPATVFATAPASVPIIVNASDWEGTIRKVDFFANGQLIGTVNSGPYQFSFNWNNVSPGSYSITAVATDSFDATATSAAINIRVNSPPTLSITSPASGSQFPSPANITINANASDSDGTIASVAFFADGLNIGNGTPIGGNQFSLTWSNVQFGSYAITALATDNDGKSTSSVGPTVTVTTPVLFVTGSTTLNASDAAVKSQLEALGHTVVVKDGSSAVTGDATGKALVIISSTVNPTSVGTKFRTVTVPVITWESGSFNNMGMTGNSNKDFGTKTGQTQIAIVNASHPLAAGLTGTTTVVSSSKTFDWGKPSTSAISIATVAGDSAKTAIFAYEPGVAMPGLSAPARRLALFLYDDTGDALNTNGTALLDAGIKWARGGGSISGSVVTSPVGSINLTSEGSVDWAHWGRNGPSAFDHKVGVTQKISNVTKIGTGAWNWFNDCPTTFSWSDGTPTLSITNTPTGINTNGVVGNGFEITMPADKTLKTLRLYVGVWYAQGKLEATLSDGSAPAYVDTSQNKNNGASSGLYTIQFKAASPGQTLKVRFTILTQYFSPNGNVAWEAATLQ